MKEFMKISKIKQEKVNEDRRKSHWVKDLTVFDVILSCKLFSCYK